MEFRIFYFEKFIIIKIPLPLGRESACKINRFANISYISCNPDGDEPPPLPRSPALRHTLDTCGNGPAKARYTTEQG